MPELNAVGDLVLTDPAAMEALADPARLELLDDLRRAGPVTAPARRRDCGRVSRRSRRISVNWRRMAWSPRTTSGAGRRRARGSCSRFPRIPKDRRQPDG